MTLKTVTFGVSLSENISYPVHVSCFTAHSGTKLSWYYSSNKKMVLQCLACTNFLHYLKITK